MRAVGSGDFLELRQLRIDLQRNLNLQLVVVVVVAANCRWLIGFVLM